MEAVTELPTPILSSISIENGQFVDSKGLSIFPWGFNYTNPVNVGLIDDQWLDDNVWQIIQSDFKEMKLLGANVVRIHLQFHRFMIDVDTPNEASLNRLSQLVDLAEQEGLYLDVTGLGAYRKSDQPTFYTSLTERERWNTQKVFWTSVAKKIGRRPSVFAFNLMNEPVVSVECDNNATCDWTPGNGLGGFHFVQNITKNPDAAFAPIFKNWIGEMTEAIRSEDNVTLITVGVLALGPFNRFAEDVDFLSPHIYPKSGEIEKSIQLVVDNQSSVPMVIEEIANFNCTIEELGEFLSAIDGQYDGLMGHYFGTPIDELNTNIVTQAIQKNFLEFFVAENPN